LPFQWIVIQREEVGEEAVAMEEAAMEGVVEAVAIKEVIMEATLVGRGEAIMVTEVMPTQLEVVAIHAIQG